MTPPGSVSTGRGSQEAKPSDAVPAASKSKTLEMIATMAKTATVFADSETDLDLGA